MKCSEKTNYENITDIFSGFSNGAYLILLREGDEKLVNSKKYQKELFSILEEIANTLEINLNLNFSNLEEFKNNFDTAYKKIDDELGELDEDKEKEIINILKKLNQLENKIQEEESKSICDEAIKTTIEDMENILKN